MLAVGLGMTEGVQLLLDAGTNTDLQNQVWLRALQYKDYIIYGLLTSIPLVHG